MDIQKTHYKKLITHVEPYVSAVSLLKRAENSTIYISDHQSINALTPKPANLLKQKKVMQAMLLIARNIHFVSSFFSFFRQTEIEYVLILPCQFIY